MTSKGGAVDLNSIKSMKAWLCKNNVKHSDCKDKDSLAERVREAQAKLGWWSLFLPCLAADAASLQKASRTPSPSPRRRQPRPKRRPRQRKRRRVPGNRIQQPPLPLQPRPRSKRRWRTAKRTMPTTELTTMAMRRTSLSVPAAAAAAAEQERARAARRARSKRCRTIWRRCWLRCATRRRPSGPSASRAKSRRHR